MAVSESAVQNRIIILPCIFIELSPRNFVFVIMDACKDHILESTKWIEMDFGL